MEEITTILETKINELETIFQLSLDEIFVTDGKGTCIRVNPACEKHCGRNQNELIGRNVKEMVAEGLFQPSATIKVLEERKPVTIIQSTASGKWLHVTSTPVFDESGELNLVISNTRDITELLSLKRKIKEMEDLIDEYNLQMESLRNQTDEYRGRIVVKSKSMIQILTLLNRVAKVDSTVLLLGESGVGKTEIAKLIHEKSMRKDKPFVEINCGAIPPNLFESELFGYERGSFSGALSTGRKGLLELADKGTVFLDEVGELSLDLQAKLLQVIQSKSFMRVGGRETKTVDMRIITATNQDLEDKVIKGSFRQDLFYRLSVIPIKIPPLRERKDDLIDLIFTLLDRINLKYGVNKILSPKMLEQLASHSWPGNVRELENTIERFVVTTEGAIIDTDLHGINDFESSQTVNYPHYQDDFIGKIFNTPNLSLDEMLGFAEKEILSHFMKKLGSTRKIAQYLNSSQSTISRKCIKYQIPTQK